MDICSHIYNRLNPQHLKRDISQQDDLREFFAGMPDAAEKNWPFAVLPENGSVSYSGALVMPDKFGLGCNLKVVADVESCGARFCVAENFEYEDNLTVELYSIVRNSGTANSKFLYDFISRHRDFMKAFIRGRKAEGLEAMAEMRLHASSGTAGGYKTCGGYVWAVQGFDFASPAELDGARRSFKTFAARYGVILDEKDLQLFAKPCHFAAFQCGVKADGKNLGKAFLLQYSWYGKMPVSLNGREPAEYRYAKAYHNSSGHENRLQVAVAELGGRYLKMMHHHYLLHSSEKPAKQGILSRLRAKALSWR